MDGTKKQRAMIKDFQCAGCVCGSTPETCERFAFKSVPWGKSEGFYCDGHVIGTSIRGGIRFVLGLPKGLNRPGEEPTTRTPANRMLIRIWEKGQRPAWDKFNVAVWGFNDGKFSYVRTYSPRNNLTRVDVCEGLPLSEVKPVYDVGEFLHDLD